MNYEASFGFIERGKDIRPAERERNLKLIANEKLTNAGAGCPRRR